MLINIRHLHLYIFKISTAIFSFFLMSIFLACENLECWLISHSFVHILFHRQGLISLTISAVLPKFHPPPCPTQENCKEASTLQIWVLYISLLLTSLGSGCIRPCVVTFAADQIDMTKSGVAARSWNLFNWYYFSMGMATLAALTLVVYIQDNVGWGWVLQFQP